MVDLAGVLTDLEAESMVLDEILAAMPAENWPMPTPAPGWSIARQIGHLAWTDRVTLEAAAAANGEPAAFAAIGSGLQSGQISIDGAAAEWAEISPPLLMEQWREGRRRLAGALKDVAPGVKLPWFGPPMSAMSMATARIMETWAHGQDIADALGITREPTDRLRHIAHLAVRTRNFAFKVHQLTPPESEFRVELESPTGERWVWGPEDAAQRVSGSALDFCLLATKRRHRDDLALAAHGADAEKWLDIVQAFAGPPGEGRDSSGDHKTASLPSAAAPAAEAQEEKA
ncbi:TIGR03084 family metal-binding protein [Arthrobacter sp. H35-D1]|uniref:TIGR03084 family metal-binding protein n=1 Tax=Arthrobacter sp. H35-D1 TaxID=3046202 RepID=UPI0024B8B002|nr:TIGR03084 family metal-binding protein [Arthrobacter sp. H35-D1]MDJ0314318.1 TIGR03084 family metal-binding protein [Arthrobacter sp. H35-D1]